MTKRLMLTIASIIVCLYVCELILAVMHRARVLRHWKAFGLTERRVDVAKRLGVSLSPNGRWFETLKLPLPSDFPLGTFPHRRVLGFKECEGWPVHHTDAWGFFNKDEWWRDAEVLIVGDSFVTCEHLQSVSITGILRERGVKAVNIGMTGAGPYLQACAMKALSPHFKARIKCVVWCYCEFNDLQDAIAERPYYGHALDPHFTLRQNQAHLDLLPTNNDNPFGWGYAVKTGLALTKVRMAVSALRHNREAVGYYQEALDEGIRQAGTARFVLLRIPFIGANMDGQWTRIKAPIKVEMPKDIALYSMGMECGHYTVEGYERMADLIQEAMK